MKHLSQQMERALLERCPNTLLSRRAADNCKSQVQPINVTDLTLPKRGLRPISTLTSPASRAASSPSMYTSLAEMIPIPGSPMVESIDTPRTPMRNRLVEKAARAYLLHSESFDKRNQHSSRWTQTFSRFLPRFSALTSMALNPLNVFNSAFQVFRFYVTGARALQPQIKSTVSRPVSRSISMPVRLPYSRDLSFL